MKSYTDIEQSRKLAEILPLESADMFWIHVEEKSPKIDFWKVETVQRNFKPYSMNIPCWSLAALQEVMPKQLGRYTLTSYWCNGSWCCSYIDDGSEIKETSSANNPVDATVKMIVKLKEKDLL